MIMFSKLVQDNVLACTMGMLVSQFRVVVKPTNPAVATSKVFFFENFRNFPSTDIICIGVWMFCDKLKLNLSKTCLVDLLYFLFERFVAFAASLQLKSKPPPIFRY